MIKNCRICQSELPTHSYLPSGRKIKFTRKTCSLVCKKKYCSQYQQWGERNKIDVGKVITLYTHEKKSLIQIAHLLGVNSKIIKRRLLKHNIPIRPLSEQIKISLKQRGYKHGKRCGEREYLRLARRNFQMKCARCGTMKEPSGRGLSVHHLN